MASHTPHTPVYETHPTIHPNTLPPPPPRNTAYSGSQDRNHGGRTPSLSVVPVTHLDSHHSTPLSAVSHYSPFTPNTGAPIVTSQSAASRSTSPMAHRQSGNGGMPYDPRDWAGGDVRANQAARARQQHGEDGLTSPPPPYSPQSANRNRSDRVSSEIGTMQEDETCGSNGIQGHVLPLQQVDVQQPGSRRTSAAPLHHRHTLHMGYNIPPPPPSPGLQGGLSRGALKSMGYQDADCSRENSPHPAVHPPTARRAVSANAGFPYYAGEQGSYSRSNSKSRWQPGMPLPGPPPGPPPASSRSQSLTSNRERSCSTGVTRIHPLRKPLHDSTLGPVPPTPADWIEGSTLPESVSQTLHIDTQLTEHDDARFHPRTVSTSSSIAQCGNPGLSRSSALRDFSLKNLRERRAQNRNSRIISPTEEADLSVQITHIDGVHTSAPNSARMSTEPVSGGQLSATKRNNYPPLTTVGMTAPPMAVTVPHISHSNTQNLELHGLRSAGNPSRALPTPPLSQKAPLSASSPIVSALGSFAMHGSQVMDDFIRDAIRRHADFLERERSAQTDLERLTLFTTFIANESSIRHQRYLDAIHSGDFDIRSARERLFEVPTQRPSVANTDEFKSPEPQASSKQSAAAPSRPESNFWKEYQPALSPIASMDYDEMSSRGRAPSRWWESQTGSQGAARAGPIPRSKRESKYMGLSKEFLMAHSPSTEIPTQSLESFFPTGNGYPQEKTNPSTFGYYREEDLRATPKCLPGHPQTPKMLDISRFITLPPPYPRHYPAVNNSHPDLASYRTTVRTLSDLSDIKSRRSRHQLSVDALRTELKRKVGEARRTFQMNVQAQIQEGSITYSEAAEAEEANKLHEFELEKQTIKAEFDSLQDVVINPLHDALNDRIQQLGASIQQLQDDLHKEARHQDPDRPQEEGDETPELLEKLTQLKWLFDTREQIYKECFEILSERNDKYKALVVFPYQWNKNDDKVRDTEAFFEKDTQNRFVAFCSQSTQRHQTFLSIIEQHVMRGVELQSSAFWDIAPGLLDLLQKLPEDMRDLPAVQIPGKEYEENPSYHQHPQQYLYSLLSHADKSTYQFIEGQINLHCLLHEVKSGTLAARCRSLQLQDHDAGHQSEDLEASIQREEAALTAELKQKASMIEQQWLEALGSQLQGTRERVKSLLVEKEAWDEVADVE